MESKATFQLSIKIDAHFKNNSSPLFLFYTLVVICSPKISFPVFANSSQIFLSVLNDRVKREENTNFVFRNDFETSFWLKQSTNQRLASAHQEVSRHKKHCQDLNGASINIKPQFTKSELLEVWSWSITP